MTTTGRPKLVRVVTRMNIGGPSRHVTILTTRGGPEFDSVLLTGQPEEREGSMEDEARQAGATVIDVPGLRRRLAPMDDLVALFWLYRYFRKVRPAIVATHLAKAGTVGRVAAALAGVPVRVHTFHGHVLDGYFGRFTTSVFLNVERLLGRLTTQFVAISPEVAADLERLAIGRGKITIVRLGLELDHLAGHPRGALRQAFGIAPDATLVGIVGRLVPIKAHDLFLEAAEIVRRSRPDVHFAIVGDGELWDELQRDVVSRGLTERVHFTGWRSDLGAVYADTDVVVCCSRNEGTPVSVIEACAAGRAVIGTRVGGIPDIIAPGVNGLLVASGDATALASAIAELVDDPDRRDQMGAAGQGVVRERYGADRMVKELKDLYRNLLDRSISKEVSA